MTRQWDWRVEWVPPYDPDRPVFPYRNGVELSIQSHIPPPPFGPGYPKESRKLRQLLRGETIRDLGLSQTQLCLRYPPLEATSSEPSDHTPPVVHTLHVVGEIACRDGRGPQVVLCHLDHDPGRHLVAKIFDPLYYSFVDKDWGCPADVTWFADCHYSREAAAYERLRTAGGDGLYTPKYHGSWTFNMNLRGSSAKTRPVRMILMEWIQGTAMKSVIESGEAQHLGGTRRLDILAQILEIDAKLRFYGVIHRDLAPRNIILVGPSLENGYLRVILVDFNISIARIPDPAVVRPLNPLALCPRSCPNAFLDWVPEEYRTYGSGSARFREWAMARWKQSDYFSPPPPRVGQ